MTIQAFNTCILWPSGILDVFSLLIDASGEKVAAILPMPKTGNLRKIGFRTGTVTSAQTLKVSMQSLDTNGVPDGTPIQSGTQAAPASDTWYKITLGADYAATKGDFKAVVIEFDTTVGNLNILAGSQEFDVFNVYTALYTGAWAKQGRHVMVYLEYDDGTVYFVPSTFPAVASIQIYNSGSTPDEYALRFQLPFAAQISGIVATIRMVGGGDLDLVLYSGTTALQTVSVDGDITQTVVEGRCMFLFATPQDIAANTVYRAAVKPSNANGTRLALLTAPSNAALAGMEGGIECYLSTRTDAGAWTDNTAVRPSIGLILSGVDVSAGSAGIIAPANLRGGFQ